MTDNKSQEMETEEQSKDLRKFSLCVIGAFGYNISAISGIACILLMNKPPPDFQLNTLRFSVGLAFATLFLIIKRKKPKITRKNIKWLCFIAAVTVSYNFALYNHYLKNLTFVGILSLQSCFAVIFISILSRIFLKTNIQLTKYLIIITTLIGLGLTLASHYMAFMSCPHISNAVNKNKNSSNIIDMHQDKDINNIAAHIITNNSNKRAMLRFTNNTQMPFEISGDVRCNEISTILISIAILIAARFLGCMESIAVKGTGLKEESTVILSFWYFILGITVSAITMIVLEDPFFPATVTDLCLWFGHAVSASSVTYFDLLAVQNIDVSVYYITGTFKLPVSFLLQQTLLKNVTPNVNMYLLVSGMVTVFLCSLMMPVYEYLKLRRKDGQDEHEMRAGHVAKHKSLYIAIPKQTSEV